MSVKVKFPLEDFIINSHNFESLHIENDEVIIVFRSKEEMKKEMPIILDLEYGFDVAYVRTDDETFEIIFHYEK